jgi:uncharacterized RmlC-like cupin family protein
MEEIEVVHRADLKKGESARGLVRLKAFEKDAAMFGSSQLAAGAKSGWHHHGARELYAYIVSGKLRIEFGKGGKKSVEVEKGDFVHVPAGLVHQDVNPKKRKEAVTVYILVGEGPTVVSVRGA